MTFTDFKLLIASMLEQEKLQEAYDLSKSADLYDLSEDIAELIYCPDDEYQEFRESIIKGLKL